MWNTFDTTTTTKQSTHSPDSLYSYPSFHLPDSQTSDRGRFSFLRRREGKRRGNDRPRTSEDQISISLETLEISLGRDPFVCKYSRDLLTFSKTNMHERSRAVTAKSTLGSRHCCCSCWNPGTVILLEALSCCGFERTTETANYPQAFWISIHFCWFTFDFQLSSSTTSIDCLNPRTVRN